MYKNTPEQLTKRHIAKLLNKLECLTIPKIASDAIKQEMVYLSRDIVSLFNKESKEKINEKEPNYNR